MTHLGHNRYLKFMCAHYDCLVLGIETPKGQGVYQIFSRDFQNLTVATCTNFYMNELNIPSIQIPLNLRSVEQTTKQFNMFDTVVICDNKYKTRSILKALDASTAKMIDGCLSYPQTIANAAYYKSGLYPSELTVKETTGWSSFWARVIQEGFISFPHNGEIAFASYRVDNLKIKTTVVFGSQWLALIYWFFATLFHLLTFGFHHPPQSGSEDWEIEGTCNEHDKVYHFQSNLTTMNIQMVQNHLAVYQTLLALGITREQFGVWNAFNCVRLTMKEYTEVK